jgi:hypothetical protein
MWRHEDACAELKSEEKRILASTPEDSRALARARSEVQLAGIRASVARRWAWRRQCAEDRAWRRNYRVDQARFAVQDALERLRSEERRLVETLEHAPRRTP